MKKNELNRQENVSNEFQMTNQIYREMFIHHLTYQWSWNYERQQAAGCLYTMTPVLKRLYKDAPTEVKEKTIKRYLEFFNTHATLAPLLFGLLDALEVSTPEDEKNSITSIKTGLMGPIAGLGDGMFWFTIWPICASIGASMAVSGNLFGAIFTFVVFNVINQGVKWYGFRIGYTRGMDIINSGKGNKIIHRISSAATVLGLFVAGCLVSTSVSVSTPLTFASGEGTIVVQDLIDKIMPHFMPVLLTLFCYRHLKKTNGKDTVKIIFGIMIVSIVLTYFGIL